MNDHQLVEDGIALALGQIDQAMPLQALDQAGQGAAQGVPFFGRGGALQTHQQVIDCAEHGLHFGIVMVVRRHGVRKGAHRPRGR